jgi:hypothetical protein
MIRYDSYTLIGWRRKRMRKEDFRAIAVGEDMSRENMKLSENNKIM